MLSKLHLSSTLILLTPCLAARTTTTTTTTHSLIVIKVPSHVRLYVLLYLIESGVQLKDDIIRLPVTNASSDDAFSLFRYNDQNNDAVSTHYHARFYESWFTVKSRVML